MVNKMKTRLDSKEWSRIDEERVGYYFQDLGFKTVGEIAGLRMFDLFNLNRVDNIRAWDMVRNLYMFLNKNHDADNALEYGIMDHLAILFVAKVIDNAINTTKTIMIQRSRWVLAGIAVILSDFIYFWIMRNVVTSDHMLTMLIVAIAGGVGCSLACFMNDKLSKDRTYVNVIMSDNLEEMKKLRDFLEEHHITNVAADSYTLDWNTKTITITAGNWNRQAKCLLGQDLVFL